MIIDWLIFWDPLLFTFHNFWFFSKVSVSEMFQFWHVSGEKNRFSSYQLDYKKSMKWVIINYHFVEIDLIFRFWLFRQNQFSELKPKISQKIIQKFLFVELLLVRSSCKKSQTSSPNTRILFTGRYHKSLAFVFYRVLSIRDVRSFHHKTVWPIDSFSICCYVGYSKRRHKRFYKSDKK